MQKHKQSSRIKNASLPSCVRREISLSQRLPLGHQGAIQRVNASAHSPLLRELWVLLPKSPTTAAVHRSEETHFILLPTII